MCANIMGSTWWNKKKMEIQNIHEDAMRKLEKQRKSEQRRHDKARNQGIRTEMGVVAYYSYYNKKMMKKRDYLERMNPRPEVYIDKNNEIQTKVPDPIKKPGDEQFLKDEEEEEAANSTQANSNKNRFQAPQ
jgi:hypothetical protein